jgi:glucose/arabinose dehydrogenase
MVLSMDNGSLDVTAIYLSSQQNFYCGYAISLEPELPSGFEKAPIANGLSSPTAMAFAPDGRLFVCEQGGSVRVIQNGLLLSANFLTLALDSTGERGLLGLAFDPDFAANQFLYVYYTATAPAIHHRISRFTACGDVAGPGSELALIELDNLSTSTENNGGMIHFGPDGKLYAAVGDNGNPANAQTLTNLLGKILRLNSDGSVPPDNPFYHTASGANRAIWALGLRNPYTFAFDPGTARMFINDKWEEINEGVAGANYGWTGCPDWFPCHQPGSRDPIFNYPHQNAWTLNGCASTAGTFYRPAMPLFPAEYNGLYFFADACLGWIRALNPTNYSITPFATGLSHPVDMKVGPDGRLYYLTGGTTGSVWAIEPMGPMLHPSKTADRLVLTWRTTSAAGFFLQAAANLPPNTWATVTNEVRFDNGTNAVALPATNAAQFFRLMRQ